MAEKKEIQEVLLTLLREKESDDEAADFIKKLMKVNESTESDSAENRGHLEELRELYTYVLFTIRTNPGAWYDKLEQGSREARRKTSFRKDFDGITEKRVTDETGDSKVFKRDYRGEFLPVGSDEQQLSDTAVLLKLVADEDYDTIERLGYKVNRRDAESYEGFK